MKTKLAALMEDLLGLEEADLRLRELERKAARGDEEAALELERMRERVTGRARDFRELLVRDGPNFRAIYFGPGKDVALSIQAGRGHYSRPREDRPSPHDYTEWEVGFFEAGEERFDDAPDVRRFRSEGDPGLAANVPTEDVQELVDWLMRRVGTPRTRA